MNINVSNKRSLFTTPKHHHANKTLKQNPNNLTTFHRSLNLTNSYKNTLRSHHHNPINDRQHNIVEQDCQTSAQILKQLSLTLLKSYISTFANNIQFRTKQIYQKFLTLQYKIADLQRKFNEIQLILHKKSKQIQIVMDQNRILVNLNTDIQQRLQELKGKYQVGIANMKNQGLYRMIDDLKAQVMEIQSRNRFCIGCQKGIKQIVTKHIQKLDSNNYKSLKDQMYQSNRTEETTIIKSTLQSLLQITCQMQKNQDKTFQDSSLMKGWKNKVMENIDLKFEIISLKQKIRQLETIIKEAKTVKQTK